jgi:hypothetical protein
MQPISLIADFPTNAEKQTTKPAEDFIRNRAEMIWDE